MHMKRKRQYKNQTEMYKDRFERLGGSLEELFMDCLQMYIILYICSLYNGNIEYSFVF